MVLSAFLDLSGFFWLWYKLSSCVLLVLHVLPDGLRDLQGGILFLMEHKDVIATA